MELKIYNPADGIYANEIKWNFEELKEEVAIRVKDYKVAVYSEDQIKEAKQDRANLNKLKKALDDKRKEVEKSVKAPYEVFKKEIQEVIKIIDEASNSIDMQIKAFEEQKKIEKSEQIEEIWNRYRVEFEDLELNENIVFDIYNKIFDSKWLNISTSLKKIDEEIKIKVEEIKANVKTLDSLPEFSFEAKQVYLQTLDINVAIQEGKRLLEIQKAKEEYEKKQDEIEKEKQKQEQTSNILDTSVENEKLYTVNFSVTTSNENLMKLKAFLIENNIKYTRI